MYRSRVLGEFPALGADSLISLDHVEAAMRKARERDGSGTVMSVDVARFGDDQTVLALSDGGAVLDMVSYYGLDTMEVAGRVVVKYNEWSPTMGIFVDDVGVGAGVLDRLRELKLPASGTNVGRAARDKKTFLNLRAEGYWNLRELLAKGLVALPPDDDLAAQLVSVKYGYNSRGLLQIESKDDARGRGLPSPDRADAVMLGYLARGTGVRLYT